LSAGEEKGKKRELEEGQETVERQRWGAGGQRPTLCGVLQLWRRGLVKPKEAPRTGARERTWGEMKKVDDRGEITLGGGPPIEQWGIRGKNSKKRPFFKESTRSLTIFRASGERKGEGRGNKQREGGGILLREHADEYHSKQKRPLVRKGTAVEVKHDGIPGRGGGTRKGLGLRDRKKKTANKSLIVKLHI